MSTETNFNCRFCDRPDPERIIAMGDSEYLQLSLGPLVEGHTMVVTREHYSCSAETPAEQFDRIFRTGEDALARLSEIYGSDGGTIFEHGRSGACLPPGHGDDHCFHAHVHLLPVKVAVTESIVNRYKIQRLSDWGEVRATYQQDGKPYLLTRDASGIAYVADPQDLPRHYLRSVVAEQFGMPELADWVAFSGYRTIAASIERIGTQLADTVKSKTA
ncbi:hypothetical protein AB0C29_02135 [Actinoplanes sp. NPDC048791]|uniref:hypothetical protein n=1 Tax=Actinoplanes sp. NPDC048791 TaxID=3154623 RepID=UPI0034084B02